MAKHGRAGYVDSIFMTFPHREPNFPWETTHVYLEGNGERKLERQRRDSQPRTIVLSPRERIPPFVYERNMRREMCTNRACAWNRGNSCKLLARMVACILRLNEIETGISCSRLSVAWEICENIEIPNRPIRMDCVIYFPLVHREHAELQTRNGTGLDEI